MIPQLLLPHLRYPNPTLVVDLNNTLMNQQKGIVQLSKGNLTMADFSQWDVDNSAKMNISRGQYLDWAWKNKYVEFISEPFPGAPEALRQFKQVGIRIVIATASNLSTCEIENWLRRYVIPFDKIIKTADKRGLGHLLIDDSPVTCEQFYEAGLPVLRYALPWNSHLAHIIQGVGWLN